MNKLKSIIANRWLLIIVILIIASFFRLYNITELPPGLYPDEAMNGNNALEAISTGNFKIFYPENNGREGLFINMQALSIFIFGNEPWALRGVSAIFGILTVLGVYLLTKELFPQNRKIALLAAFLIATSFWHILFSRIGFRAITAPFYLTWACYFLLLSVRLLKENYSYINFNEAAIKNSGKIYIFAVLAGLFYGLGFHSYIAYRATPLLILMGFAYRLFYIKELRGQIIKILIVFSAFSILAFLPLGMYFLNNPADFFGRTTQVSVFNSANPISNLGVNIIKTAAMFNFSGDWNWRHNYAGRPELFWPIGILFIISIILGISVLLRKKSYQTDEQNPGQFKKFSFFMLFSWIIIASLPIVISNEGLPHALRAILMIPPIFILSAVGGIWLYKFIYEKIREYAQNYEKAQSYFLPALSFIFFLFLIFEAYNTYFNLWGKNPNVQGAFAADYVEIGRKLNSLPKELPKYVVVEAGGTNVRGIPMPTQTTMFITDTFTPEKQREKNIYYLLPEQKDKILENSYVLTIK
ncbi:MAG: glycosyltransferase family 39 protein [Patescibacteria group bacterium]